MKHLHGGTVYLNGRVVTLDATGRRAQAIAIFGDKIAAVGSNEEVRALVDDATQVIDLDGKAVYPGFIEPHAHLTGLGLALSGVAQFYNTNLAHCGTKADLFDLVADRVRDKVKGEWVTGRGFAYDRWPEAERSLPTRAQLDKVAPDHPVALNSLGGHILLCNSRALELAGIHAATAQPSNGVIYKDPDSGEPTGVLLDGGMIPVFAAIPAPTAEEMLVACRAAVEKAASLGLTGVHTIRNALPNGYGRDQLWPFFELERRGELTCRIWLMIEAYEHPFKAHDRKHVEALSSLGFSTGFGSDYVKIGPVKIISDGWLDARTAAQYAPYADDPSMSGYMWRSADDYAEMMSKAHTAGFQIAVHADGAKAADVILDVYEATLERFPRKNHRHRLEHVPLLTDEAIDRIARLGLLVCTVPSYRRLSWYKSMIARRLGPERTRQALRYRTLMKKGVVVFGGSDCHPCEDEWISPLGQISLHAVEEAFEPEERFTVEEAVKMFTVNAAYASFEEDRRGTIEPGKWADLTVLSEDLLAIRPGRIREVKVERTVLGGRVVYDSTGTGNA